MRGLNCASHAPKLAKGLRSAERTAKRSQRTRSDRDRPPARHI